MPQLASSLCLSSDRGPSIERSQLIDAGCVVDAAIRGARAHGRRLFAGLGFAPDACASGYTFAQLCDKQLELVSFSNSLPRKEQREWLTWSETEFKRALADAGRLFTAKLLSQDPHHESSRIDEFLPADAAYFENVAIRLKQAEPIMELRAAFPTLLADAP